MFKIISLSPTVFLLHFDCPTDLALSFMRYQEYYECPNPNFRNNNFKIEAYKKWYIEQYGEFSYVEDWVGFNLPSRVFEELLEKGIPDRNEYDDIMIGSFNLIKRHCKNNFYIIGVSTLDSNTLQHEQAHGLYYTNPEYKKLADDITKSISSEFYSSLKNEIIELGYTEEVIDDEIQAYMSTGGTLDFEAQSKEQKKNNKFYREYRFVKHKFRILYNSYKNCFAQLPPDKVI